MADEIEKKYRLTVEQKTLVEERLVELGAEYSGEDFEENVLFAGGDLLAREAVLRLRRIGARTILTFKERVSHENGIRHYREHETEIGDFAEGVAVFEGLGYRPALVYEKRRKTYRLREAEIVLDELAFGDYMEIEGSFAVIGELEKLIGAADFAVETETYPHLTRRLGVKTDDLIEARFAAERK